MGQQPTHEVLRQRSIKLRQDQDDALDEAAYRQRKSFSELLREVVDSYLAENRGDSSRKSNAR